MTFKCYGLDQAIRIYGDFLLASARSLPACRDGVRLAFAVTQIGVLLETNSLELVALWHYRRDLRSELAPILSEIEVMAPSFSSFQISHVRREANAAAHVCAKSANRCAILVSWLLST